jgi:hypothetical protein
MEKIQLISRYGDDFNWLEKIEPNIYKIHTRYSYRTGENHSGYKYVDLSGGPMIIEGHTLEEANREVKSIIGASDGIYIEFK